MSGKERAADSIWTRVGERSASAQRCGALVTLSTRLEWLAEAGLAFSVRVLDGPDAKREAGREQRRSGANPFLPPYEPELFVGPLSETHVCLLNKFKVVDRHALILTREFEPQESLLNEADFTALEPFMECPEALAFYNSAPEAGASQPHKHLQVLPLPAGGPTAPLIDAMLVGSLPEPRFRYAAARLPSAAGWRPAALARVYRRLLKESGSETVPYNLVATPRAMVVVPRSQGSAFGIAVNALGFAGSLFARSAEALARLREIGPLALLRAVGYPARVTGRPGRPPARGGP